MFTIADDLVGKGERMGADLRQKGIDLKWGILSLLKMRKRLKEFVRHGVPDKLSAAMQQTHHSAAWSSPARNTSKACTNMGIISVSSSPPTFFTTSRHFEFQKSNIGLFLVESKTDYPAIRGTPKKEGLLTGGGNSLGWSKR
jgi:hypothetical protein